jgi:hypothetical protein
MLGSAFAQKNDTTKSESEYRTIFGKPGEKTKVSGFGTFTMDFMNVDNKFGLMMGSDMAILIENMFYIGFYGRGLTSMPTYKYSYYVDTLGANVDINRRMTFGHGGLIIGYIHNPENPVHFGFNTKFGVGSVGFIEEYNSDNNYHNSYYYGDNSLYLHSIYFFTPQVDFEMNLTYWFKFKISAGYQFVSNKTIEYSCLEDGVVTNKVLFNTDRLRSPVLAMSFIFGWFK